MNPYAPRPARYFVTFVDGQPAGFYNEAVHGFKTTSVQHLVESGDIKVFPHVEWVEVPNESCLIPENAIEISEEDWLKYIS